MNEVNDGTFQFDDRETYYLCLDLRACYLLKCEIERNFPRDERGMQKILEALKEILKCLKLFKSRSQEFEIERNLGEIEEECNRPLKKNN